MKPIFLRFPNGKDRCLTFSYDDGTKHDRRMTAMMEQAGVKATLNLCSGWTPTETSEDGHLSVDEIGKLAKNPLFEIACHGKTHPYYNRISELQGFMDLAEDRLALEQYTGGMVRGAAYPYGAFDDTVIETFRKAGIVYSRITGDSGLFTLPKNWLAWRPTCHHRNAQKYCESFLSQPVLGSEPLLFYIWGHSYEFDTNNNWELLEQLLATLSGKENVWYATNIEIYEYIMAYQQIYASADGTKLCNPTTTDLWVAVGAKWNSAGEIVMLPAGQTVSIET